MNDKNEDSLMLMLASFLITATLQIFSISFFQFTELIEGNEITNLKA